MKYRKSVFITFHNAFKTPQNPRARVTNTERCSHLMLTLQYAFLHSSPPTLDTLLFRKQFSPYYLHTMCIELYTVIPISYLSARRVPRDGFASTAGGQWW